MQKIVIALILSISLCGCSNGPSQFSSPSPDATSIYSQEIPPSNSTQCNGYDSGKQVDLLESPLTGVYTCNESSYSISPEEFHYDIEENDVTIEITYPVVSGLDSSEIINAVLYEIAFRGITTEELQNDYNLSVRVDYSITYFDQSMFSILLRFDIETPGRGEISYTGVTIDVASGDIMTLNDLEITIKDVFSGIAYARATIPEVFLEEESSVDELVDWNIEYSDPNHNFYLTENGVGLIFYIGGPWSEEALYEVDYNWRRQGDG